MSQTITSEGDHYRVRDECGSYTVRKSAIHYGQHEKHCDACAMARALGTQIINDKQTPRENWEKAVAAEIEKLRDDVAWLCLAVSVAALGGAVGWLL